MEVKRDISVFWITFGNGKTEIRFIVLGKVFACENVENFVQLYEGRFLARIDRQETNEESLFCSYLRDKQTTMNELADISLFMSPTDASDSVLYSEGVKFLAVKQL